ncbi:MAG: hypothetical protein JWN76_2732 [Chitinophagaceae bacterium]|nr:hypothetical protein [Chitinophagaceae bacterium]
MPQRILISLFPNFNLIFLIHSAPMRKLCFFIALVYSIDCSAQEINFNDHYRIMDSLTRNLSSYRVVFRYIDASLNTRLQDATINMPAFFPFLKEKDLKEKSPDFTIEIKVRGNRFETPFYNLVRHEDSKGLTAFTGNIFLVTLGYNIGAEINLVTNAGVKHTLVLTDAKEFKREYTSKIPDAKRDYFQTVNQSGTPNIEPYKSPGGYYNFFPKNVEEMLSQLKKGSL